MQVIDAGISLRHQRPPFLNKQIDGEMVEPPHLVMKVPDAEPASVVKFEAATAALVRLTGDDEIAEAAA